LAATNA
jgi:hypothetical protein